MGLDEATKQWLELFEELNLDYKDAIHSKAVYALVSTKHLFEPAKKTTVIKYEKKLDKVTQEALQLFNTIQSLNSRYKSGLIFSLSAQYDINVNNSEEIERLIQSLAEAAQQVKKVCLAPIPNGFYNPFLFQFVTGVLDSRAIDFKFTEYLIQENVKQPTKDKVKEFLHNLWKNLYSVKVRDTAIHLIQIKLSTSRNKQTAQKTVDANLSKIVDERIEYKACKLIRLNTISAEEITQIRTEMGLE